MIQINAMPGLSGADRALASRADPATEGAKHRMIQARGPVCIVDDDDWVCDSLAVLLDTYGFAVRTYPSGEDFLADGRRHKAGCLVIDQHMPTLDGLAVVAALRRDGVTVPTILITGRLEPGLVPRARALQVLEILEKPFPAARLLDLVRGALGRQA